MKGRRTLVFLARMVMFNISLDAEKQLQNAASRRSLRAGQL